MLAPWKKSYDKSRQRIKKQRHYFANKDPSSQSYGFSSGHVWMWELDYKESRVPKNWCFWTVVLEETLESPLDSKEIQPVNSKGNLSWLFIARTAAEVETPILWPPDVKNWLIGKDPDAGKDWKQEEKGMTENEILGWHHWLDGYEWVNSRSWWWTGRSGVLQSMGSQRVRHDWVTELNLLACEISETVQYFELSLALSFCGVGLTISSPVATAEFPKFAGILSAALSQHHLLGFDIAQLKFHYLHELCL